MPATTRPQRGLGWGIALVLASAAAYGAMPVLAKIAFAHGVAPAALLAHRFTIATLLFALLARGRPPSDPRTRRRLWALGGVFVCNAAAYFAALETVPASVMALLLYTYPALVALLAALLGLEPMTWRGVLSAALVFVGAGLTTGGIEAGGTGLGVALGLASALIYAFYVVLCGRLAAGVPSLEAARRVSEVCAAVFVPWALLQGRLGVPLRPGVWLPIGTIGVLCTVFALMAFLAGLARVGPGRAAVLSSVEIVVTLALASLVLGEAVTPLRWLGGLLILAGVALQGLRPSPAGRAAAPGGHAPEAGKDL